jgi:excinuclease ABC subunit B
METNGTFRLVSDFEPRGDQPAAIRAIVDGLASGVPAMTLLGVTGSGKTFTMANVIAALNRPTLVLAPNKTLAAQLYREFKEFFPGNAVEYFVSYYDYYQPEAYIPSSDTYIEKDSQINEELDKLRLSASRSLLERRDVVVVASVSCIYGIGSPADFNRMAIYLEVGAELSRDAFLRQLVALQYARNDRDLHRGAFRVRGDVVDVALAYEERLAIRVQFFGNEIESLAEVDPVTGDRGKRLRRAAIYPASVYVTDKPSLERAIRSIGEELALRLAELEQQGRVVEWARLKERTERDIDMLRETGTCVGIENYSRHLSGRAAGESPYTLLDYFPDDFLLFVDESHIAIPQVRAMYNGDRARKTTLVEFGFRLPSALDNRPLTFEEFEGRLHQVIFVSATPEEYELQKSGGIVVEQVVRPTGLVDPIIEVRPTANQVADLVEEIRRTVGAGWRVLATTLTKRFSEELTEHFTELGIRTRYMHSDIDVLERVKILADLRAGVFDVLVGINLLREGLDLPEVALVAILDADKEGYLRSARSLIQTVGRAARNAEGRVIMYADRITDSMKACIGETDRRRERQVAFNLANGIVPQTVRKKLGPAIETAVYDDADGTGGAMMAAEPGPAYRTKADLERMASDLKAEMRAAAKALEFERAAALRDRLRDLERKLQEEEKGR